MSEFKIIKQDKKGNIEKAAIMNAVAFYTQFKAPAPIYDERDLPRNQVKNWEWTVQLIVDEDTADAYDESVSEKQSSKKMSKEKVAKSFRLVDEDGKVDDDKFLEVGLDPDQKKFFMIKKAQRCQKKDGGSLKHLQPRAIQKIDGKPVDITFEKLIGNGSVVSLLMRYMDQGSYGVSSYPDKMIVESLVEYAEGGKGLSEEEQDFLGGDVEFAEQPDEPETTDQGYDEMAENAPEEPDFGDDDDY